MDQIRDFDIDILDIITLFPRGQISLLLLVLSQLVVNLDGWLYAIIVWTCCIQQVHILKLNSSLTFQCVFT